MCCRSRRGAGRLPAVHSFHRRVAALVVPVAMATMWACTKDSGGGSGDLAGAASDESLVPPDATLPDGELTPEFVADRVIRAVFAGVGLVFPATTESCVRQGLLAGVDDAAFAAIGVDGIIGEQPPDVQDAIFAAFDACIDGEQTALIGSSTLINAGATAAEAACVYQVERQRLGIGGMYRFGAGESGEIPADPALRLLVTDVFADCGLDPAILVVPTVPPDTRPPTTPAVGATTTSAPPTSPGETTTTVRPTTTTGPPITLTRPSTVPDPSSTTLFPPRPVATTATGPPGAPGPTSAP